MMKRKMVRKEKGVMDIDITSLMDIMVILLRDIPFESNIIIFLSAHK